MHSFHHSRGRILFEVFCALAIAEACVGAWRQTGAWALLPAAFVSALYGLVHLFDMRRPSPIEAAVSQPAEFVEVPETVAPASQGIVAAPTPGVEQPVTTDNSAEEVDKPARAPRATRPRRAKAAPKGGSRRSTREDEKVANVAPSEEPTVAAQAPFEEPNAAEIASAGEASATEPAPLDDGSVTKLTPPEDAQAAAPWRPDETSPVPLRPLFEPEPFVRQQRAAFGRKA